ncbi:MAG: phosphate ABC transporter ATP-binding protein [Deltaproteobacteria bacterium]|jgi:phosphate transport system ATP-binding protein|nr:phosphate ABC transporter ATP-binding protein [Deltaproteobacteria bacterium]
MSGGDISIKLETEKLSAWYGDTRAVSEIDIQFQANSVTAIIGPSGCGKTTLIRCLNRMHELGGDAGQSGRVLLDGADIYAAEADPARVRQRIGMVFDRATPFPTMSIRDNVLAGLALTGQLDRYDADEVVERSLSQAALWDEVKDVLARPGTSLSSGQQQRLCIARALTVEPEVLLLDEPCATLDPIATARIEDLLRELRSSYTIVIVTHSMRQATRVSEYTAFILGGKLVEFAESDQLFTSPRDSRTEDYITGKFG